ncbi:MAG TPA: hypothetical protein VD927_09195 [Chryseosolibacter sp.]|nr:hypothetical protein [Chryseosolibacter sp.]
MTKQDRLNIFATICAIWFLATGWMWVYYINLVVSFPVALIGFYCWKKGKHAANPSTLNKIAFWLYVVGFVGSFGSLAVLLIFN